MSRISNVTPHAAPTSWASQDRFAPHVLTQAERDTLRTLYVSLVKGDATKACRLVGEWIIAARGDEAAMRRRAYAVLRLVASKDAAI